MCVCVSSKSLTDSDIMQLVSFLLPQVLDEMYRLLRQLRNTDTQPPRSYDLLQGLRDLSTMAMEHFEEFIAPVLKAQMNDCSQSFYFSGPSTTSPSLSLNSSMGSGPFTSTMDMSGTGRRAFTRFFTVLPELPQVKRGLQPSG